MLDTIKQLRKDGLIDTKQSRLLTDIYSKKVYSLYYEHKAILLTGVLSLSAGLGIWIYENIGSLGHNLILVSISALFLLCLGYVTKHKRPFQFNKVETPGAFHDYILLLACLLFLTLQGYLQYQYSLFTGRWDMGALIPTILFFYLAYQHDHQGVLTLAITGLTAWVGLEFTPKAVLAGETFADSRLIMTGIIYSILLFTFAVTLSKLGIKQHFTFNYLNFCSNILCLSLLHALFEFDMDFFYLLLLLATCVVLFRYARTHDSFIFLLYSVIYGYIGISYTILKEVENGEAAFFYFAITGAIMVFSLINFKKVLSIGQ